MKEKLTKNNKYVESKRVLSWREDNMLNVIDDNELEKYDMSEKSYKRIRRLALNIMKERKELYDSLA